MDNEGEIALKKVAGGASILFLGVILSRFFGFLYRILIARYLGPGDYGLISLGLSILTLAIPITVLGLPLGVARYISFYKGKNDKRRIKGILNFTFKISSVSGLVSFILFFLLSNWLANTVFKEPSLAIILKIFAFTMIIFPIKTIILAAIRGFQHMRYWVYSETIISKSVLISTTFLFLIFGFGIIGAAIAYSLSILAFFISLLYFLNRLFPLFNPIKPKSATKELLVFSWPLIFASVIWAFVGHLDTLMLGYFDTAANVGIYNAAFPSALLISVILTTFGIIFMPVSSELLAKNKLDELKKLFRVVTKWIFLLTLPGFLLLLLFANTVLRVFFGTEYVLGALPLSILAVGYFIASIVGPTAQILQALGKTKIILFNHSIVLILDFVLNLYLIPLYSIVGAAIATMVAISTWNILSLMEVYHYTKVQPYNLKYLRPTFASLASIGIIFILKNYVKSVSLPLLIGFLILFLAVYAFLFLLFKSLEKEDIMILLEFEKWLGTDLSFFKKIIKRFL